MIEEIIAKMREEGADDKQILEALEQMLQEGKITPEDLEHAKGLLHAFDDVEKDKQEEKAKAEDLFGLKFN